MESQKHSYINAYVLSKDNAKAFAEFNLSIGNKTKNEFVAGTEYFYLEDSNNEENNIKFEKEPIGTMLILILNNYDEIKKVLENHKNMVYNAEKERDGDYRDSLKGLKEDLTKIAPQLAIFNNFIDSFAVEVYDNYHKVLDDLFNKIQNCKYFDQKSFKLKAEYIRIDNKIEKLKDDEETLNDYINALSDEEKVYLQHSKHYKDMQEQFIYMSTAQCLKDKCISFFDNWLNEFEKMKGIVDNAFLPSYKKSRHFVFSGIELHSPSTTIEFSKPKLSEKGKPKAEKYKYELTTLTDFVYANLYHLQLHFIKVIKCKYCQTYFIPTENNQVTCGDEARDDEAKDDLLKSNKGKIIPTSQIFYNTIYTRLRRNHKEEFEEFIQNYNYQEKRKLLEQKYSSEEEIEQELLKWLTEYDKEFFAKFPSKTRKPTTIEYWNLIKP